MVTLEDLKEEAERFLRDTYGKYLNIPIVVDPELHLISGAFVHASIYSIEIKIAQFLLDFAEDDVIYDVLRHELVHYVLFEEGEDYEDGTDTFEDELKRLGITASDIFEIGVYHAYSCDACAGKFYSPLYIDKGQSQYQTMCCKDSFSMIPKDKRIYSGRGRIY